MYHGTLEVQRLDPVPLELLQEIDEETRLQLNKLRAKLERKKSRTIPPLKIEAPFNPELAQPSTPPTPLGSAGLFQTKAPDDFVIMRSTNPSAAAPGGFSSEVNEPSVVKVGEQVYYTGNWYIASSSNGGQSFSFVNPFSAPFASTGGGFCCDQVSTYDPGTNSIFLLQQYIQSGTTGVQRINVDQGADGTFDCSYDITPQTLGFAAGNWLDFPDLAVSNNHLFHSSNVFSTSPGTFTGAFAARYSLADIGQCSSVPFDVYTDTSGFFSFRFARGATNIMYFADHISTSSLRIWHWAERRTSPLVFDRSVSTWNDAIRDCTVTGATNPCGLADRRIQGAYVADGVVAFFWMASQGGGFAYPHTRIAQFTQSTLALSGEPIIWSSGFAWIYPSVAVNQQQDLGGTIMAAGGTLNPTCLAWTADDVNGGVLAPLQNTVALSGTTTPSINRSGDYNWVQPNFPNHRLWAGACFVYTSSGSGNARFLIFGREKFENGIFADGFESGVVNIWSDDI